MTLITLLELYLRGAAWTSPRWLAFQNLCLFNSLRPRQNGHCFADDTFKRILLNENITISIKISLRFVPKGLINNIPVLVQIMAWRRPGDKPLSEPMVARSLTHICITRPQWVNSLWPTENVMVRYGLDCAHVPYIINPILLTYRLSDITQLYRSWMY